MLVDANGNTIGPLIDLGPFSTLALKIGGRTYVLPIGGQQLVGSATNPIREWTAVNLHYETADCGGNPYRPSVHSNLLPRHAAVGLPGRTLYVSAESPAPVTVATNSRRLGFGNCQVDVNTGPMIPLTSSGIDLSTIFTPPFTVVLP